MQPNQAWPDGSRSSKSSTNSCGNGGLGSVVGGLVGLLGAVALGRRKRQTPQQHDLDDDDEPYSPVKELVDKWNRCERDIYTWNSREYATNDLVAAKREDFSHISQEIESCERGLDDMLGGNYQLKQFYELQATVSICI